VPDPIKKSFLLGWFFAILIAAIIKYVYMNKWDKIFESKPKYKPLNDIFFQKLLEKVKKEINPNLKNIIDLGCGTSRSVFQFARMGFDVVGVDFSEVALSALQNDIDDSDFNNIKLINQDLNDITLDLEADIFICVFTYTFINDKEKFLKKIKSSMKEDSVFVLITPVTHENVKYLEIDKPQIAVEYSSTVKLLKSVFSVVEDYHHDYIGAREDYVTFLVKK